MRLGAARSASFLPARAVSVRPQPLALGGREAYFVPAAVSLFGGSGRGRMPLRPVRRVFCARADMDESRHEDAPERESGFLTEEEVREPKLYRVLLHNDDYTTMEFVVLVLVDIFRKSPEEASEIMLSVHEKGIGVCGVYPREIAEFRIHEVAKRARQAGFPLLCTMEEE